MGFTSELRYPTTWYFKLITAVLTLVFFALLAVGSIASYMVYRIVRPQQSHSTINLEDFPGHPQTLPYSVAREGARDGWFFPGLKSAPTIILCPGYGSSRGELVTLASSLQNNQYNVLLFDFSGQGSSGGHSTLGFQEVGELRAVMNAVANRGDVDANRFGLWGVNLGAYTALAEATADPRVRALAVESPYDHPSEMLSLLTTRSIGSVPFVTPLARMGFRLLTPEFRNVPRLEAGLNRLAGVAQLYMESPEEPGLADSTAKLFQASPMPHELVILGHGNFAGMLDDEKRNYENRIVSFFLTNLPPTSSP